MRAFEDPVSAFKPDHIHRSGHVPAQDLAE